MQSAENYYVCDYQFRSIQTSTKNKSCPALGQRYASLEHTVLIYAESEQHAFDKTETLAKEKEIELNKQELIWQFDGITQILPVYEKLEDGAELCWTPFPAITLKTSKKWGKSLTELLANNASTHAPINPPEQYYLCHYYLRFITCDDPDKFNPEKRFTLWENARLIFAHSLQDAFEKTTQFAMEETQPYQAYQQQNGQAEIAHAAIVDGFCDDALHSATAQEKVWVQFVFEGIGQIHPLGICHLDIATLDGLNVFETRRAPRQLKTLQSYHVQRDDMLA